MHKYNLDAYSQITFSGINYVMPDITCAIIKSLIAELHIAPSFTENVRTKDKIYKRPNNSDHRSPKSDENWEKIKLFQATKIEKKEGVDKIINDIRICLNKLSNKNYDIQVMNIIGLIDQIEDKTEHMTKIAKSIFDIASTNKFFSELYAKLYYDLIQKYTEFNANIDSIIQQYYESISQIVFVDEKVDFDKFCDNNKVNDKRKAMSAFIVNLMKQNIINPNDVLSIIIKLEDMVMGFINVVGKTNDVDEITENIFILVTLSLKHISISDICIDNIKICSQTKPKECISLSSRAIFKYMDILDIIKKNKK